MNKPSKAASKGARAMALARWANVPKAERRRQMQVIGLKGGRPMSKRRCPCGKVTMRRALARTFDCCRAAGVLTLNTAKVLKRYY